MVSVTVRRTGADIRMVFPGPIAHNAFHICSQYIIGVIQFNYVKQL